MEAHAQPFVNGLLAEEAATERSHCKHTKRANEKRG